MAATALFQFVIRRDEGAAGQGLRSGSEPVLRAGAGLNGYTAGLWLALFDAKELRAENDRLREQLITASLRTSTDRSQATLAELTERISTTLPSSSLSVMTVPVIGAPQVGARQVLQLAMGSREGLATGMTVLGPAGIIGSIIEVTPGMSTVRLITDPESTWGAEVDGRGELGLLAGTGQPDTVEFRFRRTATDAVAGEKIVTSGMIESIAPAGFPFGEIVEVRRNKRGEPSALVRLAHRPADLRTVWVVPERRLTTAGVAR